jgi:transposase
LSRVAGLPERGAAVIRPTGDGLEIYLCVEPVDFRKQAAGLATLVQDALALDPFSSQLFVFTNRRRSQCRILVWERAGFVLWSKRLEKARFAWPRRSDTVVTLSVRDLNLLLDGYDIWRFQPHQTLRYASMF